MKRRRRFKGLLLLLAGLAGGGFTLVSCSPLNRTVIAPLEIPGAVYVGNRACADCHAEIVRSFPGSPHARWDGGAGGMPGESGCESCHGPGSRHIQSGGVEGRFILNPGREPESCLRCHLEVSGEFHLPYRHPVVEGKLNCVQCHDPHGLDIMKPSRGLAIAAGNDSCGECHREQEGPKVYEHEALREGCVVCHQPHGSINAKLLVQRDNNLCLRCHAQAQGPGVPPGQFFIGSVPHTAFVSQGACWSAGCHTAIHGSNMEPKMLY